MVIKHTPSPWAVEHFGEHAADVTECVVEGLTRAQRAAWEVQVTADRGGATTKRPYGSMWDSRYNSIVEQFRLTTLPNYESYRPQGASYHLAVVNRRVLIPFRHADNLRKKITEARVSNQIPRAEARRHGVEPPPTLFDIHEEADITLAQAAAEGEIAEDLEVIYIAFVANASSDEVLAAWWGQPLSMEDDGRLHWTPEALDLSTAASRASGSMGGDELTVPGTGAAMRGFAEGEVPMLNLPPRTEPVDRPSSEAGPDAPDAQDRDE